MANECGRCNIDCSEYASGSIASARDLASSEINIEDIEKTFNDKFLPKDIRDALPPEISEGSEKSPINNPKKACYEILGLFCCNDPNYSGYIFYNSDRIDEYSDNLSYSVIIATLSTMSTKLKLDNRYVLSLLKNDEWREKFFTAVRNAAKFVVTYSVILHERFHWAEGCGADKCEGEAKATAYSIKKVIDIITGKQLKKWETLSPIFPSTLSPVHLLNYWHRRIYPEIFISDYFPELLVAPELSVEALVLIHSKMPCYSNFHKYLYGRKRIGSIIVRNEVMEFPWIGLSIAMHFHDPYYAHIHGIRQEDNVELKQIDNISPEDKELKEIWGCCKS
jgi:hypothetical protein